MASERHPVTGARGVGSSNHIPWPPHGRERPSPARIAPGTGEVTPEIGPFSGKHCQMIYYVWSYTALKNDKIMANCKSAQNQQKNIVKSHKTQGNKSNKMYQKNTQKHVKSTKNSCKTTAKKTTKNDKKHKKVNNDSSNKR